MLISKLIVQLDHAYFYSCAGRCVSSKIARGDRNKKLSIKRKTEGTPSP